MYRNLHIVFTAFLCATAASDGALADAERVTYAKDVAPILNAHCVGCHRPGQIAPMSLMRYEEVRPWVKSIRSNVANGTMPPWHATTHVGTFMNDRSLTDTKRNTILAWIDRGAPRGNPKDLPPAPAFPDNEWKLGEPDFVVELPEVRIPADGPDIFKNLPGKVQLPEDRGVTAIEILPGNPKVVHHVIVYQVKGFNLDFDEGWLGAWAAGTEPMVFPAGTGRLMKKGANIVGDMHYHPAGAAETDRSRIGLHFAANNTVEKELVNTWVMNTDFRIPAGDPHYEVRATHAVPQDGYILAFAPHMHYRGKDFTYTARYPDGDAQELLRVDRYDFNWQTNYVLEEPFPVPKGTVIECVAHFDNSAGNPSNPDPTIDVTFGDESYDEMMIGFFDFIVKDGVRPKTATELRAEARAELFAKHPGDVFGLHDAGKSNPEDATPLYLPQNGDGVIYLRVNGVVTSLPVLTIRWTGNTFDSRVPIEAIGDTELSGAVEPDGSVRATLKLPEGREIHLIGFRLTESNH